MSNEKVLTKEIAEQFLENVNSVELSKFTAIEDEAAERLSKCRGGWLSLDGLTSLSDAAAESLSKHEGDLSLSLDNIPESAAAILRQHPSRGLHAIPAPRVRAIPALWQYASLRWCVYQIPLLVFGFVMRNAGSSNVIIWILIFAIPVVWVWRKPIFRFLNESAK